MPTDDDFVFVIFPDEDNDEYDEPMLYERGKLEPLFSDQDVDLNLDDEPVTEQIEDEAESEDEEPEPKTWPKQAMTMTPTPVRECK